MNADVDDDGDVLAVARGTEPPRVCDGGGGSDGDGNPSPLKRPRLAPVPDDHRDALLFLLQEGIVQGDGSFLAAEDMCMLALTSKSLNATLRARLELLAAPVRMKAYVGAVFSLGRVEMLRSLTPGVVGVGNVAISAWLAFLRASEHRLAAWDPDFLETVLDAESVGVFLPPMHQLAEDAHRTFLAMLEMPLCDRATLDLAFKRHYLDLASLSVRELASIIATVQGNPFATPIGCLGDLTIAQWADKRNTQMGKMFVNQLCLMTSPDNPSPFLEYALRVFASFRVVRLAVLNLDASWLARLYVKQCDVDDDTLRYTATTQLFNCFRVLAKEALKSSGPRRLIKALVGPRGKDESRSYRFVLTHMYGLYIVNILRQLITEESEDVDVGDVMLDATYLA